MIRTLHRAWRHAASAAAVTFACALLAACGSGGVSDNSVTSGGPIAITPSTATLYSDLPTAFLITGGTGTYIVLSSDQAVVSIATTIQGNSLTVVPNEVSADTAVTLSVRDAGDSTATAATATLTVKPRTVSNVVTITPSASQSAACGTAVCSGGDAEVAATLTQGGVPLAGRSVRFDVVSGDIRVITSSPGAPEFDALQGVAITDSSGIARIRIRVLADATSQTALLRITDVSSGFTQSASVTIAPSSNAPLNAQPATIAFTGPDGNSCATGTQASIIVFGGRPPYTISQPGAFTVTPTLVTSSGGSFTVGATGQCSSGSAIAVVDANGASVSVNATNAIGIGIALPSFVVAPQTVTFTACSQQADIALAGGTGNYFVTQQNSLVSAQMSGTVTATIRNGIPPSPPSTLTKATVTVGFSDGRSVQSVSVTTPPECGPPP